MANLSALYQDPQFQALTEDKKSNVIVGIVGKDPDFQKLPDDRKAYVLNGIMAAGREKWGAKKETSAPKEDGKVDYEAHPIKGGPTPKLSHEVPEYSSKTLSSFAEPISRDDVITGLAQKKQEYQQAFKQYHDLADQGMDKLKAARISLDKQLQDKSISPEQRKSLQIKAVALSDYEQSIDTNIVDALGMALPLAPIHLQSMVKNLYSMAKGGLSDLAEALGKSKAAREKAVNDLIDHGHTPEYSKTAVDTLIKAKSEPAMGAVERILPTEEKGLTPVKAEHVWTSSAHQNQKVIDDFFPPEVKAADKAEDVEKAWSEMKGEPALTKEQAFQKAEEDKKSQEALDVIRKSLFEEEHFGKVKEPSQRSRSVGKKSFGQAGMSDPALLIHAAGITTGALAGASEDPEHPFIGALEGAAAAASITTLAHFGIGKVGKLASSKGLDLTALAEHYKPDLSVISTPRQLADAFHWGKASSQADSAVISQHVESAAKQGVTKEVDQMFRDASEGSIKLNPKGQELYDRTVQPLRDVVNRVRAKYGSGAEEAMKDLGTRIAKNHRSWLDAMMEGKTMDSGGAPGRLFAGKPGATKSRTVFATDDGHIVTTKRNKQTGDYIATFWKDGEVVGTKVSKARPTEGTSLGEVKLKQAKQKDIEQHSPVRYVDSDLAVWGLRAKEMLRYDRDQELLNSMLNAKGADGMTLFPHIDEGAHNIPEGFRKLTGDAAAIPQFRDRFMPANLAEVIEDVAKSNKAGIGNLVNDVVIRTMMLNFFPHVSNEFIHWWDARGISGVLTPTGIPMGASKGWVGFIKTFPDAMKSVLTMDKFQTDLMRHGGALMAPSRREAANMQKILRYTLSDAAKSGSIKEVAKAAGMSVPNLLKKLSDGSSSVMWGLRDIFYTQLVKEQMLMGKDMRAAVQEVGRHMPEYRLPSRVLGSRKISQVMNSPLVVFSRYHHNMLASLGEMAKEVASPALKGHPNEFVKGLDRTMALVAMGALLMPALDKMYTATLAKPGESLSQRRAGPLHPIEGVEKIAEDPTYRNVANFAMGILTPSPMLTMAPELFYNRSGWSGREIVHPGSEMKDIARYLASKLKPVDTAARIAEGHQTTQAAFLNALDILTKTQKQKTFEENMKRANRAARAKERQ